MPLRMEAYIPLIGNEKACYAASAHCPRQVEHTGGKGSITQWIHAEHMVGSETIRPTFTQWVRGGYFSKVPTKVPTR